MRFKTGVKVQSKKEWNTKKGELANDVDRREEKMGIIKKWRVLADELIHQALLQGYTIAGDDLWRQLEKYRSDVALPRTSELRLTYESFLKEREEELLNNPRRSAPSIKDYRSLKNALRDYELDQERSSVLADIDKQWCASFEKWLAQERPSDGSYTTRGGLNRKTIKKRFDTLKTFFRWAKEQEYIQNILPVVNYKVYADKTIIDTLTIDEVRDFYNTDFDSDRLNRVRDIFTFCCHTGLRWMDLIEVSDAFMRKAEDGSFFISKITHKSRNRTEERLDVPLSKTALEIFQRYDYDLNLLSHAKANEYLKEAMRRSGLFERKMEKKKKNGQYMKRWEYFSFHDARRTFISNLVNSEIPLSEVMRFTGHAKLSTLQQYIDPNRQGNPEYIEKLD